MAANDKTATPTRKEREAARHRGEILDAAVHLFAEHGYHETTMQMVAEASEFSVGYLYKHFPGKEEMYREVLEFHMNLIDGIIEDVESRGLPPLEELRATYEGICEHFNHHRDFMRIYHKRIEGGACQVIERKQNHQQMMVETFDAAITAGKLRPMDTTVLAAAVAGASEELFHTLSERDVERPFDTLTDTLFSLLIDPLRKS